eukprot:TRINITY_DN58663_c0_g1_i1.p1 TRINITY_DN58663_c0_g1~~TRINITY_DN58663_c0_g1_i1.p1  ORF type:complete len:464 (-),score=22.09 TRINITY_DN58663_c0_g1_i1:23-1414(-)
MWGLSLLAGWQTARATSKCHLPPTARACEASGHSAADWPGQGLRFGRESRYRPIGKGNGKKESAIFLGWSNCYLGCNDPYGETLHSILSLIRAGYVHVDRFVSVVGSLVALQFLLVLRPKVINFFDMNPHQIKWAQMLCELIAISKTPREFISRIFARDVVSFERSLGRGGATGGRLTYLNQHRFMRIPVSERWQRDTMKLLSSEAGETYRSVLVPMQDDEQRAWYTTSLLPCEDRRKFKTMTRSELGPQGRLPGDGFASFLYGEGWLTSQWTFDVVKNKLASVPITWTSDVDFPESYPEDILKHTHSGDTASKSAGGSEHRTLVFSMDMWSSNFAHYWPIEQTLAWRGEGRLALIQSITAFKHELVQELVGESSVDSEHLRWRSFTDWDSSALLPPHICQVGDVLHSGCQPLGPEGDSRWANHPMIHHVAPGSTERRLLSELTRPLSLPIYAKPRPPSEPLS